MIPAHGKLLYEGKAKRIYQAYDEDCVLVEFKNDATAFNALKRAELLDKGRINCQISAHLFEILETEGVPTHYLSLSDECWMLVKHVEIIPLEVVIRNVAAGSLCREMPLKLGEKLLPPLLDLYFKDDVLGDPLLTDARLNKLELISDARRKEIEKTALKVNSVMQSFLETLDLLLVDFKLEFGVDKSGKLLLADEISPDTCRIWDQRILDSKDRILDKDRFRQDLGGVIDAYGEVLKRIQGVTSKPRTCS